MWDAEEILQRLCQGRWVEKIRYTVRHAGTEWEVDEFLGENRGLLLAEVELESESQEVAMPDWLGPEVSSDPRYRNVNLAQHPYSRWTKA